MAGAGLHESFTGLRARTRGMVYRFVERGRVEDPEALEAEVWLRVWRFYPFMVRKEARQRARGLPGHRWRAWVGRVARRLVLDEQRRQVRWRRTVGVRAFAPNHAGGESLPWMAGSGWDELLDGDSCPDPAALSDPAARAEWTWEREALARGLKELDALQAAVVTRWGSGAGLREIARELGVTVYAARRAQQEGIARLRRRLA